MPERARQFACWTMRIAVTWILIVAPQLRAADVEATQPTVDARLRRPLALALSGDERFLYVANRCGTLSVVDVASFTVVAEHALGQRLSDVKLLEPTRLLITDELAHEVIVAQARGTEIQVLKRVPVSPFPVSITVTQAPPRAYVASLWSRRMSLLDLPTVETAQVTRQLDLQIAPRTQTLTPDHQHLLVADSFSGRVAIISLENFQVVHTREFPGHNIRGLAVSPNAQMLVIAHQMLNDLARTERNDVHWGLLMSNDLRWLQLSSVLSAREDLYAGAHMHPLGEASSATADPSGLAFTPSGTALVTLGGVNEVAIGKEQDFSFYRLRVGKRPTAVVTTRDSGQAFVANTFGDSVSRVDIVARKATGELSLGASAELTLADQGELLFYDAALSHDGWMSCHSCHTDGHSNGGLNDNFSDGSFGASKRVLSLLGVGNTEPLAWNGSVQDLARQLQNSTEHTMQKDETLAEAQSNALIAYLQTLSPPPSVDQLRGTLAADAVARGQNLFQQSGCSECHTPPLYTSAASYDVGLEDQEGNRQFNPPSLRGLSQRGPYFHDNRAATLEDVFRTHAHQLDQPLSEEQLGDLIAFLRSL